MGELASSEDVNEMGRNLIQKKRVLYSPARANLGSTPQQVLGSGSIIQMR